MITPGIRLLNDNLDDQKNVTTPEKAIKMGAKYLVMGRSVKNNLEYITEELIYSEYFCFSPLEIT